MHAILAQAQAQALAQFIYVVRRVKCVCVWMCVSDRLHSPNALFTVLERIKNRTNSSHAQNGGPNAKTASKHM